MDHAALRLCNPKTPLSVFLWYSFQDHFTNNVLVETPIVHPEWMLTKTCMVVIVGGW